MGIDASRQSFKQYQEGIYNDPECGRNVTHAVTIVGYDSDGPGKDYYIVNSFVFKSLKWLLRYLFTYFKNLIRSEILGAKIGVRNFLD